MVFIVDSVKAEQAGISPRIIKQLKDHCKPAPAIAAEMRYLWPDKELLEILEVSQHMITKSSRAGTFPNKEGAKGQKHYDMRKVVRSLWQVAVDTSEDTEQKIKEERLKAVIRENEYESGQLVEKSLVQGRIVAILKAVINMFRYQIKTTAPLMVGCRTAGDAEKIMRMHWNNIIKVLKEHVTDKDWLERD